MQSTHKVHMPPGHAYRPGVEDPLPQPVDDVVSTCALCTCISFLISAFLLLVRVLPVFVDALDDHDRNVVIAALKGIGATARICGPTAIRPRTTLSDLRFRLCVAHVFTFVVLCRNTERV